MALRRRRRHLPLGRPRAPLAALRPSRGGGRYCARREAEWPWQAKMTQALSLNLTLTLALTLALTLILTLTLILLLILALALALALTRSLGPSRILPRTLARHPRQVGFYDPLGLSSANLWGSGEQATIGFLMEPHP